MSFSSAVVARAAASPTAKTEALTISTVSSSRPSSPPPGADESKDSDLDGSSAAAALTHALSMVTAPLFVERSVIHEALIRNSVFRESKYHYDPLTVPSEASVDLLRAGPSMSALSLSYRGIFSIDNLDFFSNLRSLKLDNNQIEHINGLGALWRLELLDLSFNKISTIENISHLKNLTELSLFGNEISRIGSSLDSLHKLQILSLGNNAIADFSEVKSLRNLKALRLVVLRGNPFATQDDYELLMLAYLNQLTFLDYAKIHPAAVAKARDAKLENILILEAQEKEDEVKRAHIAEEESYVLKLKSYSLNHLLLLFGDLLSHDSEFSKLKILPHFDTYFRRYEENFIGIVKTMAEELMDRFKGKDEERRAFELVVAEIEHVAESKCKTLTEIFDKKKKKLFDNFTKYSKALQLRRRGKSPSLVSHVAPASSFADTPVDFASFRTAFIELRVLLKSLVDHLMSVEMSQVTRHSKLMEEFEREYSKLMNENVVRMAFFFRSLMDAVQSHFNALTDLTHTLMEHFAREDGNGNINAQSTTGQGQSQPQTQQTQMQTQTQQTGLSSSSSAAGVSTKESQDSRASELSLASPSPLGVGVSVNDEVRLQEIRSLLSDKELLHNMLTMSHENHDSRVLSAEDHLREREESSTKEFLKKTKKSEYWRNRKRVAEIFEFRARQEAEIEEKLEELNELYNHAQATLH